MGICKSPTVIFPHRTNTVQKLAWYISFRPKDSNMEGWVGVDTYTPLHTSSLTIPNQTAGECLNFRSVWLRNLQTWPCFNLARLGLGRYFHSRYCLYPMWCEGGGTRKARLRRPLFIPCVSVHYSRIMKSPIVMSQPRLRTLSLSNTEGVGTERRGLGGWVFFCFGEINGGETLLLAINILSITKIIIFSHPYLPSILNFSLEEWGWGWG